MNENAPASDSGKIYESSDTQQSQRVYTVRIVMLAGQYKRVFTSKHVTWDNTQAKTVKW